MTNDEAREYFRRKGLKYSAIPGEFIAYPITWGDVMYLWCLCEEHMGDAELRMSMRKKPKLSFNRSGSLAEGYLRVDGTYFKNREAISFNRDGFIGFAGWASESNVKPFINAFIEWCDWFVNKYGEKASVS